MRETYMPPEERKIRLRPAARWAWRSSSAELLGQADDDALGTAHEAEPVEVLVLGDLVEGFGPVAAQSCDDVVDVVDGEHDAADTQRVCRGVLRLRSDGRR